MNDGRPLPPPSWPPPASTPTGAATDRSALAEPLRQSPVALAFIAFRFVKRLGWSALVAAFIFVSNGGLAVGGAVLAIVVTTVLFAASALSWWRFTFHVVADELVVTKGVVSIERLVIQLDRVQSVDIEQRLLHRPLGLVSARVDTAGSNAVEFEIDAIDRHLADALRRVATDARSGPSLEDGPVDSATASDEEDVLVERTLVELVVVGLTRSPLAGLVVLAPLVAYGDELGLLGRLGTRVERSIEGSDDTQWGATTLLYLLALVAVVIVGGAILQVVREVIRNWNLRLTRTPSGLRRTAGLFTTTSRSSTVRRVQAISTDDSPPQRWLGFTHLRLRTFGDNDISLPGTRPAEVARLRRIVFGASSPPSLDRGISRAAVFLAVRNVVLVAVPVAGFLFFAIGWWSAWVLAAVPLRWATARRRWTLRRWSLEDGRLAEVRQLFTRHAAELPIFKAQVVVVSQSFFERRRGLATLQVRSADGSISVPLIPLDLACGCRDLILHAVETDRRRFL